MTTPSKNQIIEEAFKINARQNHNINLNTPTESELKENGDFDQARNELMRNQSKEYLAYVEKEAQSLGYSLKKESEAYLKTCVKHSMFEIPFDLKEATKSNILISGSNHTGKSRLACGIASIVRHFDWSVIVFDNSSVWREISDLESVFTVEQNIPILEGLGVIYDLSYLTPRSQRKAVDKFLKQYWNTTRRKAKKERKQTLMIFEEFQMYGRNSRYSDNLARIMSSGRNLKIRCLGITIDLALIDPFFIRLCMQRYHGKIGIEENSKRKFKSYYGSDWCRVAYEGLECGDFIYLNKDKLKIVSVPLFEAKTLPLPLNIEKVYAK